MATVFETGSFESVAKAASELFQRGRDGTILLDKALLGNQVCGIIAFTSELVLGKPGELVPIGDIAKPHVTEEEAFEYLKFVEMHGLPKTGVAKAMYLAALVQLVRAVVPFLPEPYATLARTLLDLIG